MKVGKTTKPAGTAARTTTQAASGGKTNTPLPIRRGEDAEREMDSRMEQRKIEQEERKKASTPRFWLKVGAQSIVTVVDSQPVMITEHNLKINGRWGTFRLCRKDIDECPPCESGDKPYDAMLYTIINHTGYTKRDGSVVKHEKQLLALKHGANAKFKRKKVNACNNDVKFCQFEFARDSEKEENTGTSIEFIKRWEPKELLKYLRSEGISDNDIKELCTPYKYEDVLVLGSVEDYRRLVGQGMPFGADTEEGGEESGGGSEPTSTEGGETGAEDNDDLLSQLMD